MKTRQLTLLLFFSSLFLNSRCKKDNEPQLPPETTIGAMTFGCKIDGKVFVPKGSYAGPDISAQYLYLGPGPGGGWYLNIGAANRVDNPKISIGIITDSLRLIEGSLYELKRMKGYAYGDCLSDITFLRMNAGDLGNLFVTKHDTIQRILSGRFSFTASRSTGEKVNITEGRFDIRY